MINIKKHNNCDSGMEFSVFNNVHIEVVDKGRNEIRKSLDIHNKASRNMVKGLLRFLMGYYTNSYRNTDKDSRINLEDAKDYIPCYVNIGDGGVIKDTNGKPTWINSRLPNMESTWNNYVNYSDTILSNELSTGSRVEIGSFTDSFSNGDVKDAVFGDADQIVYSISIPPGHCNVYDTGDIKSTPCCGSEIGLFASSTPGRNDLLAKVKLTNRRTSEGATVTDTLYIRPQDTVLITWTISILALGEDSIYTGTDSNGNTINYELDSTLGFVEVNEFESEISDSKGG